MTGGYGCIGSWVAKQLVEGGHDVWIFDLKEDTHRLDLVLNPERAVAACISSPATSRIWPVVQTAVERVGAPRTSSTWPGCRRRPAGPIRSWGQEST